MWYGHVSLSNRAVTTVFRMCDNVFVLTAGDVENTPLQSLDCLWWISTVTRILAKRMHYICFTSREKKTRFADATERPMTYPRYEYKLFTNIIYARKYNVYFALSKDFSLKVCKCSITRYLKELPSIQQPETKFKRRLLFVRVWLRW